MNEEQEKLEFTEKDMEWHRRVKEIAVKYGAEPRCLDLVTINRFVTLKDLFEERRTALRWAVEHVPFREWGEAESSVLRELSVDNYVVLVARAHDADDLEKVDACMLIGEAVIEAVRKQGRNG